MKGARLLVDVETEGLPDDVLREAAVVNQPWISEAEGPFRSNRPVVLFVVIQPHSGTKAAPKIDIV